MNKKIVAILIALLGTTSLGATVLAERVLVEPPFIYPPQEYPEVMFAEGVAFDKETKESKQVVFLVMKYDEEKNIYLIIEDQTYKMTEITNETYDLGPGTKVFQYESEDESILTILIQGFERWGQVAISGDFKNYLITFKPVYYNYPRPMYEVGIASEVPGLGKVEKGVRGEIIEETRPVRRGLEEIENIEGINIRNLLRRPAKPIAEWIS